MVFTMRMRLLFLIIFSLAFHSHSYASRASRAASMDLLEKKIQEEQEFLGYPASAWRQHDEAVLDVAVIGGGMLGTSIAFALQLEGVYNVEVFDAAKAGKEGPWLTTARMKTLRSGKSLQGPAVGIAHLTFRAWYEAKYGKSSWERLGKIPTKLWGKYLVWMKKVLKISLHNEHRLVRIEPNSDETLTLYFKNQKTVQARKVVLATGRSGFGGYETPLFMQKLSKKYWAHSSEEVDLSSLHGKRVIVIGAGASAFDAAASSLEHGAKKVTMIMRRDAIPQDNYFAVFGHTGFKHGYFSLSDQERCELFLKAYSEGIPPPIESVQRLDPFANFELLASTCIDKVEAKGSHVMLHTTKGVIAADFIFLGTGFAVNGEKQVELQAIYDHILLWRDKRDSLPEKLGRFPYLGPYFEFCQKVPGEAPYIDHIHCFNYGAFLSHGRVSGDIDCIDVGIKRLAQGIAIKLFLQDMKRGEQFVPECPNSCQTGLDGSFCVYNKN